MVVAQVGGVMMESGALWLEAETEDPHAKAMLGAGRHKVYLPYCRDQIVDALRD